MPSIQAMDLPDAECNAALSHFECASNRAKLQMERRRQEERIALEVQRVDEEREKMIHSIVRTFNNDHTYKSDFFPLIKCCEQIWSPFRVPKPNYHYSYATQRQSIFDSVLSL